MGVMNFSNFLPGLNLVDFCALLSSSFETFFLEELFWRAALLIFDELLFLEVFRFDSHSPPFLFGLTGFSSSLVYSSSVVNLSRCLIRSQLFSFLMMTSSNIHFRFFT